MAPNDVPAVVPIVTQSHTGLHWQTNIENSTHELAKLSSLFSAFRKCLKLQNWYHNSYGAYRTVLVMFCVRKFYFVDFYGMFTSSSAFYMASENACALQSREKYYFSKQNKTLLVMFYRHNKTFWYQFCNFKHFLKAENSEDSLTSSCVEFSIGLSCNPVWDWVTVGTYT